MFSTQFHPEFGPDFVRAHLERYQRKYMAENLDVPGLAANVRATPVAGGLLRRFLDLCAPPPAVRNKRSAAAGHWHHFSSAQSRAPEAPPHEPSRRPLSPSTPPPSSAPAARSRRSSRRT